jgi:hypothetical protein
LEAVKKLPSALHSSFPPGTRLRVWESRIVKAPQNAWTPAFAHGDDIKAIFFKPLEIE